MEPWTSLDLSLDKMQQAGLPAAGVRNGWMPVCDLPSLWPIAVLNRRPFAWLCRKGN